MTSKVLVIVNGPSYAAVVKITTPSPTGLKSEEVVNTYQVRGGSDNQACREFYLGTNQTVEVSEIYAPVEVPSPAQLTAGFAAGDATAGDFDRDKLAYTSESEPQLSKHYDDGV